MHQGRWLENHITSWLDHENSLEKEESDVGKDNQQSRNTMPEIKKNSTIAGPADQIWWSVGRNLAIYRRWKSRPRSLQVTCLGISGFQHKRRSGTVGKDQSWNLAAKIFVLAVQTAIVFLWSVRQAKHKYVMIPPFPFGFLDLAIFICLFSICIFGDGMTFRILKSIMRLQRQTGAECSRAEDFLMQPS